MLWLLEKVNLAAASTGVSPGQAKVRSWWLFPTIHDVAFQQSSSEIGQSWTCRTWTRLRLTMSADFMANVLDTTRLDGDIYKHLYSIVLPKSQHI